MYNRQMYENSEIFTGHEYYEKGGCPAVTKPLIRNLYGYYLFIYLFFYFVVRDLIGPYQNKRHQRLFNRRGGFLAMFTFYLIHDNISGMKWLANLAWNLV